MSTISASTAFELIKEYCQRKQMKLHVSDCSFCNYPVGYIWLEGKLYYDSGCDCLQTYIVEERTEKDLFDYMRQNPGRINRLLPLLKAIIH